MMKNKWEPGGEYKIRTLGWLKIVACVFEKAFI